jgi:predicted acylesterase/phospholipase RssA
MAHRPTRRQGFSSGYIWFMYLALSMVLVQGCAALRPRTPLPEYLEAKVAVPGMPHVRAWGDEISEDFTRFTHESVRQERAAYGEELVKTPVSFLALSGGGDDGAFGAGVLCGWSAAGTRPKFKLVTGISTGALMAPFAFLGSAYDASLQQVYTEVTSKDIFRVKNLLTLLWRESVADTWPLAKLLEKHFTEQMVAEVAAEHAKGRRLIIGTTQLDAQRLVLWDMGAIASSGDPEAVKFFRKIILTSASVPGAFPPQYIRVQAGRGWYEEMHVDGGTTAEVVLYETALKPFAKIYGADASLRGRPRFLYIIRNSQIKSEWENVKPRLGLIGARAIYTLIKTQGIGDLYRLYAFARRDKMDYNLAVIPEESAPIRGNKLFDKIYMNELFDLGYDMASKGYPWLKHPPGFDPDPIFTTPKKTEPGSVKAGSE